MHRSGRSAALYFRNFFGGHSVMVAVMPNANHKYRRLVSRLPDQMKMLMELCGQDVVVVAHQAGSMAWNVDFQINATDFQLQYDRGVLVVIKDPAGEAKVLGPKEGTSAGDSMSELAAAIVKEQA